MKDLDVQNELIMHGNLQEQIHSINKDLKSLQNQMNELFREEACKTQDV